MSSSCNYNAGHFSIRHKGPLASDLYGIMRNTTSAWGKGATKTTGISWLPRIPTKQPEEFSYSWLVIGNCAPRCGDRVAGHPLSAQLGGDGHIDRSFLFDFRSRELRAFLPITTTGAAAPAARQPALQVADPDAGRYIRHTRSARVRSTVRARNAQISWL